MHRWAGLEKWNASNLLHSVHGGRAERSTQFGLFTGHNMEVGLPNPTLPLVVIQWVNIISLSLGPPSTRRVGGP